MIYLDNSATTFPKPQKVREAVLRSMQTEANPGRSGHRLSLKASEEIYLARKTAVRLFHVRGEENVIFTLNCTAALNLVMKGLLRSGDHVVVSEMEHNAVMRPLAHLQSRGVTFTRAKVYPFDHDKTVDSFRRSINASTKMIICTHASNVWGLRLPVERLAALAHQYGLTICVDAAQSAGVLPIDLRDSGIDYLCIAGHKGLYGPMGTGMLLLNSESLPDSLTEGGTGSNSVSFEQPSECPDKYESGTPNLSGIAGLRAGMEFVMQKKQETIARHEFQLIRRCYQGLSSEKNIRLYFPEPDPDYFVPILSFNFIQADSETAARMLHQNGIAVRAGLHCNPAAHEMMNTLSTGAIRISPSVFSTAAEIDRALEIIRKTAREWK